MSSAATKFCARRKGVARCVYALSLGPKGGMTHPPMSRPVLASFFLWAAVAACSTGRGIRPLGAGKAALGLSLGGPVVSNLGAPTPLPLGAALLRVGATDRTDVDAAVHLPVSRVVGLDVGASHLVGAQRGPLPALMVGTHLTGLWATQAAGPRRHPRRAHRALASATVRASWRVAAGQLAFVGLDLLAQSARPRLTPSVSLGWRTQLAPRWSVQAELAWLAFSRDSRALVVHYADLAGRGSLGLQLGAAYAWDLTVPARAGTGRTARALP